MLKVGINGLEKIDRVILSLNEKCLIFSNKYYFN